MIKLKNINKIYDNEKHVLNDINISFNDTGLYSIIGRSGTGKTTLINIISGLDTQTSGEIIHNYSDDYFSTIVFQDSQLIEGFTVYENIKLIMELFNCFDEKLLLDTLDKFDLVNIKDSKIEKISGGEKQRVSIIRALLSKKPVIICDEPTSALDAENAKIVSNVLKEISKERLVIVVTHDKEFFTNISDGIFEIKDGNIKEVKSIDTSSCDNKIEVLTPQVKTRNLFNLSFYQFKKNLARIITYSIFLLISIFLLTYSLNSLYTSGAKRISKAYNQESVTEVSFHKAFERGGYTVKDSLLNFDWSTLKSNEKKTVFKSVYIKLNDVSNKTDKIILGDQCPTRILYGTNVINDNEVILTDYFAKKYTKNVSELLNQEVEFEIYEDKKNTNCKLKVVGISESKQGDNYNYYDNYIFINENTYNTTYNELSKHYYASYIRRNVQQTMITSMSEQTNECSIGRMPQNDNEIVLGRNLDLVAGEILNIWDPKTDYVKLIGLELTLNYFIPTYTIYNDYIEQKSNINDIEFYPKTYTIVGISNNNDYHYIVTDNEFDNIYNMHFDNSRYGITIFNDISAKEVKRMLKIGLIDFSNYSEKIEDNIKFTKIFNILLLIISFIFLLISFYISVTYINASKRKKTRIIGIFASFGIKKKDMVSIIFIDAVSIMVIVSIVNMFLSSIITEPINSFFKTLSLADYVLVSFNILSILTILLILLIVIGLYYLLCKKKINKTNIIDLVYEK